MIRSRPTIAYITAYATLPPNRGGRIRAHHLWRALSAFGLVLPIIVGDAPDWEARSQLRHAGATLLPRRFYQPEALERALQSGSAARVIPGLMEISRQMKIPDHAWANLESELALVRHCLNPRRVERIVRQLRATRPSLAVLCDSSLFVLAPHIRALGIPIILAPHNHDSALYETLSQAAPDDFSQRWNHAAGKAFAAAEREFLPHADQLWVCSQADKQRFADQYPSDKIRIIPNVYDIVEPSLLPDSQDLVFVGQAGYFPNEDAIFQLLKISSGLDARGIAHRMRIVGRTSDAIRQEAAAHPSVDVVGEVDSPLPYLDQAAVAPVALRLGGGTRLKILEAMSAARPVLSTPIGIEGIEAENGVHAVIEPDLDAFPDQIAALLQNRERAQKIARQGWELAHDRYSHQALLGIMGTVLQDWGLAGGKPDGRALALNLGAAVTEEICKFNPHTRLLSWNFGVSLSASAAMVTAKLEADSNASLPNAFVALQQGRKGMLHVQCSAILPASVDPGQLAVQFHVWGSKLLRYRPPVEIMLETAAMISVEPEARGVAMLGWSAQPGETILPPPDDIHANETSGMRFFHAHVPAGGSEPALGVQPAAGAGQILANPAIWTRPRFPSTARLRGMENRHEGEVAWLIGNGPSVRLADLDALAGKLTFCFNRFHLAYGQTSLRATYTVTGDKQMIEDFGQQIVDEAGGTVFVAHDQPPDLLGDYVWLRQIALDPPLFSRRPDQIVAPGGSSLFVAMQLAYYMGVRRFYIYGADFEFRFEKSRHAQDGFRSAMGEGNHFIADYRGGRAWCPPSLRDIGAGFLAARRMMEAEGGAIRNATRGGLLEIFEREAFESALAASGTQNGPQAHDFIA